jgi:ZIP family zinc transporter
LSGAQAALLYATLGGITIPLGAFLARLERIHPSWLEREFRLGVIAFGGGVLLAAVALVMVPEGSRNVDATTTLVAFGTGGAFFFLVDRIIERHGGAGAQLMAMLLDFVPESMAMGAMLATQKAAGILLAFLIALQNLPEGFNAYRELKASGRICPSVVLASFCALVLLGPLAAWLGFVYLRSLPEALGAIMLFSAGGILYLTFEDIAPQAHLERHWGPPLGAVAGFMLGLLGHALVN